MTIRTYTELRRMRSLTDRFEYLAIGGAIGDATFGFDRWMNQRFYSSREWRDVRRIVLARDEGFDLGCEDFPIGGRPAVHHMNPITVEDIEEWTENLIDPEFLITCSIRTHNAVHYGDKSLLPQPYVERTPGDTLLWGNH
jgi:hypothetical protein